MTTLIWNTRFGYTIVAGDHQDVVVFVLEFAGFLGDSLVTV